MSIKKYFEVAENIQSLANKTSNDISGEIESSGYHEQDIIKEERFIPYTDFKKPENFARWGSAEEYYESSIKRIYGTYPYDGSLKERLEWENESTYLDLYLLKERYPRTNGYIILSADSTAVSQVNDGYGRPSTPEYIFFRGGPNPTTGQSDTLAGQFTGSNYYEPSMNRASNLQYDLASRGSSLEFWLKKDNFSDPSVTSREVIFDMWNGQNSSSADYGRLRLELSASGDSVLGVNPLLLTALSGTTGFYRQPIAASTFTTSSLADGNWHHYAVTMKSASAGVTTKFYVDGQLNNTTTLGTAGINDISTPGLRAHIGALVDQVSGSWTTPSPTLAGDGKLAGSLDEFRYWKTQRSSKDIGRYWFTQVGGGVNTDPKPYITTQELANVNLGVYYKFNEGITGIASTDSVVLDFSGRYSNGTWTGYSANSRNTGSAIVSSSAATHEFLDPIIYVSHPKVQALKTELQLSGSNHDVNNNAAIYNSIPSWISEEDTEGTKNVKYLTQILGSYFDTLHIQIDNLNTLGEKRYVSGSFEKPIPFAEKLVSSTGMVAPNLFLDADVLEKLADRSEDRVYAMSLTDIKNTIYQNIYNNISYIYKSKGTEKAFRNLIRCFGIDDELIKSNMYASNVEYELRNNRRNTVVADKFIDFNTEDNQVATVFNYLNSANANSVGFITSSTNLTGGFSTTLEAEIMFPLKPSQDQAQGYFNTNVISSSLFGMHGAMPQNANNTSWRTNLEAVNFQVYAVRDELLSDNVTFVLTSSGDGHIPVISSSLYQDVYNNQRWNLSVRIRPDQYPVKGLTAGANSNYVVELHGVQAEAGEIMEQFTVSGSISSVGLPAAFMTGSRRAYIGAHRTNMTGNVLQTSDVKVNACRYWLDYVEDEALAGHILDTENHGAMQPHFYAFPFQTSASFGDVKKIDTLVFNWEFLTNTGSNASGHLSVADISSGSSPKTGLDTTFSIGNLLNQQHTAQGRFFKASSTSAIDKDFVVAARLNLPENVQSEDMVKVLNAQEQDVFTSDSRPTNYFFAFEKSMYQVISEEMINYFANLKDFNNLIGDQVERYRPDYKQLSFIRQKFFEQVGNDSLDFDKFYEFYKWFDSSLSLMLGQLVPASADFSDNVRTMIENHVLERPKYQQKFPFLQRKGGTDITSSADGNMAADSSMLCSPEDFAQGTAFFANTAMTKRQIGSSNTSQNRPWKHFHAPVSSTPAGAPPETEKMYWHRYLEERTDATRQDLLTSIKKSFDRRVNSPVKLAVEGYTAIGGVGRHHNFVANYVFEAAAAWGRTVGTNAPVNILLAHSGGIEKLLGTTDEYYPTFKQRLGFKLNPGANSGKDNAFDGNMYAPFSLYSSSVTTGYNAEVVTNWTGNVEITNLHHDFVAGTDIPMQGPFTEKYVGGRQYRHTALNKGPTLDTVETRAEGFRIQFNDVTASGGGTFKNSLAIIPPNSLGGPADWWSPPTAYRMRTAAAKRPVNIRNIKMTTGSTIIGNYEKNYQVINTGGRTQNDPYFKDQSFNFALYPETLATRGRFPLYTPDIWTPNAVELDGSAYMLSKYASVSSSAASFTAGAFTTCFWMKPTSQIFYTGNQVIVNLGRVSTGGGAPTYYDCFQVRLDPGVTSSPTITAYFYTAGSAAQTYMKNNTSLSSSMNSWIHVACVYPVNSLKGGSSTEYPTVYINGVADNSVSKGNAGTFGVDFDSGAGTQTLKIGQAVYAYGLNNFYGDLCDVSLWDGALTAANVSTLYNAGVRSNVAAIAAPYGATPGDSEIGGLVVNYKLGEPPDVADDVFFGDSPIGAPTLGLGAAGTGGALAGQLPGWILRPYSAPVIVPSTLPYVASLNTSADDPLYNDTANVGGSLDYTIPARTGSASQETVIVNRFAGSGYEVMSLGYMDPAHEEMSVYNALPYHNLAIIDYGLSGSASADPLAARTITVVDQLDKNRGLNQRATLHAGQYGVDSAYGAINVGNTRVDGGLGYPVTPSWHKTNRNRVRRMDNLATDDTPADYPVANNFTASVYDNLYVQHAIPRSEAQYAWITGSMIAGKHILGLNRPSCFSASTLSQLVTASDVVAFSTSSISGGLKFFGAAPSATNGPLSNVINVDFVGLSTIVEDPITSSLHLLGFQPSVALQIYPTTATTFNSYINKTGPVAGIVKGNIYVNPKDGFPGNATVLNAVLLNRNGPYGWPTWKQIRAGESKVARNLRKNNLIGTVVPPPRIPNTIAGQQVNFIQPTQPNSFVDFYEAPIESSNNPIYFYFEDNTENSDPDNNIILTVPYGNRLEYFSNPGLNNYLGLQIDMNKETAYDAVVDIAVSSSLSLKVEYSQRVYPSMVNAYNDTVRARTTFSITDIWVPVRAERSETYGGLVGSFGQVVPDSSIWPTDAQNNFTTVGPFTASAGAGELMNTYSRFSTNLTGSPYWITPYNDRAVYNEQRSAPTYACRVQAGLVSGNPAFAGIPEWVAPQQAGKDPYKNYTTYSDQIRKAAKDYSIVPEFRASTLMGTYLNQEDGNFLADLDNMFELTGTSINNSSQEGFYRTYSNADFLKYFKYVDDDLNEKRSGDLKVIRDSVSLNCEAFIKFLPYKGFYPAERTLELASLFSSSYAQSLAYTPPFHGYFNGRISSGTSSVYTPAAFRILAEPIMSPGILFNTIKSGLAVSNYVLYNQRYSAWTGGAAYVVPTASQVAPTALPEGNIMFGEHPGLFLSGGLDCAKILTVGSGTTGNGAYYGDSNGYNITKMPFEALYRPADFFNKSYLYDGGYQYPYGGTLYDTAPSGTLGWLYNVLNVVDDVDASYSYATPHQANIAVSLAEGLLRSVGANQKLAGGNPYILGMDNFLCETLNMFVEEPATLLSKREEDFNTVKEGNVYTGKLTLYKTVSSSVDPSSDFVMYNRASAFGYPLGGTRRWQGAGGAAFNSNIVPTTTTAFSHVTPPYFAGQATVSFTMTASWSGEIDVDTIFSTLTSSYERAEVVTNYNAADWVAAGNADYRVQLNDSFNLFEKIQEVPTGTNTQKARWAIQSKFETPIMNFANVGLGQTPLDSVVQTAATSSAAEIITRGMWHQYGTVITSSNAGVFLVAEDWKGEFNNGQPLWDLVGMETGKPTRLGRPKKEFLLEEAVIAVPFKTVSGARQFIGFPTGDPTFNYKTTRTYHKLVGAMNKYVFPPKFDFTLFDTVDPVLMYVFEFSAKLNQKDITDIWQNLPPDVAERFEVQNAVVEEKELIDSIVSKNHDIEWMVFKVKKRAKKDFEKFRRSLVSNADISAFPDSIRSPLTYNWPYDYFSLVELARIEETATYVSTDLKKNAQLTPLEELNIERITFVDEVAIPTTIRRPTRQPPRRRRRRPPPRRRRTRGRVTPTRTRRRRATVPVATLPRRRRVSRSRPTRFRRRTRGRSR